MPRGEGGIRRGRGWRVVGGEGLIGGGRGERHTSSSACDEDGGVGGFHYGSIVGFKSVARRGIRVSVIQNDCARQRWLLCDDIYISIILSLEIYAEGR